MFRASPPSQSQSNVPRSVRQESAFSGVEQASAPDQSFPIDLIRFSIQAEKRKKQNNNSAVTSTYNYELAHAAPQSSLNYRDVMVLDGLFAREDMPEIAGDVDQMLGRFMPAPCWDDDAFEFLNELL